MSYLIIPTLFRKSDRAIAIPSVRLSIRPSRYLLLNHWTKSSQICCVSYSHEWGVQRHTFFLPHPQGPWGGAKRSNIIKFQLKSQFQRFLNQTLCVFSKIKDIKRYKTYQTGFSFSSLGHVLGVVGLGVLGGGFRNSAKLGM